MRENFKRRLPVHEVAVFTASGVSVLHIGGKLTLLVTFLKVKTRRNVSLLPKRMIIANLKINSWVSPADTWCRSELPLFSESLSLAASLLGSSSALPRTIVPTTIRFETKNVLIGHNETPSGFPAQTGRKPLLG